MKFIKLIYAIFLVLLIHHTFNVLRKIYLSALNTMSCSEQSKSFLRVGVIGALFASKDFKMISLVYLKMIDLF